MASGGERFDSGSSHSYPVGVAVCYGGLHDRALHNTRNADRDSYFARGRG